MKLRKQIILLLSLVLSITVLSFLDDDYTIRNIQKIASSLYDYARYYSPQKVYLHMDKSNYYAGEHIWFKAYLLDGITHYQDSLSEPVYVELINPYRKAAQIIRLKIINGEGTGSFFLADTIPEGIYQVRAYTNWMKNFGPEFFFNKNLEIRNPKKEFQITAKEARSNKKNVKKLMNKTTRYQIGFFPEGGRLIAGTKSKIAFKATEDFGAGIPVTGAVYDQNNKELVEFETAFEGMGYFTLRPLKNHRYYAMVKYPDGSTKKVPLPEAEENAVGLMLYDSGNLITAKISSNKPPSNDRPANDFILIGQVRGKMYYAESKNLLDKDSTITMNANIFPSGVVQFTLFNNRLMAIAERLFFVNHNDFVRFDITADKLTDSVKLKIKPVNSGAVSSTFSGSVTVTIPETNQPEILQHNILTELLLTSDLPGNIPSPAYFINTAGPQVKEHADLLMLTNGWKRFVWADLTEKEYPKIRFTKEDGITVAGKITREFFEIPVKEASVKLYILTEYNDEYNTISDKNGRFSFDKLDYWDTLSVRIVARKPGGGKNVLILLNDASMEEVQEYYGDFFLTTTSKIDMKKYRQVQADIAKKEMIKRQKELDSIFSKSIYGTPDYVIWGDEIPEGCASIPDAIKGRVPGVNVAGNSITIRGINTLLGNTDPLVVVDGVTTSLDALYSIPVEDVERIEILKGPSTAMYGSRGANGVIAIYTKHGTFMKKGEISFSMLGYHVVERYYSPSNKSLTNNIDRQQLPVTVSWNPEIKIHPAEMIEITFPLMTIPRQGIRVEIEGITNQGTPGQSIYYFNSF